jgi:8-oxo-dGTP pyrophosphatase MutT (NUDIX family)
VDAGETPQAAAAREAWEEAGVEGDLDPDPLLWATVTKSAIDLIRRRSSTATPIFALLVRRQRPAPEEWRGPTWMPVTGDRAAVRCLRRPWPSRWRIRAVRALVDRLDR